MNEIYTCPHCTAQLNPEHAVMLLARRGDQGYLMGFHPELGNYEMFIPADMKLVKGDRWSYFCPVCQADLMTQFSENLCSVDVRSEAESHRVFFSRTAGDEATFVVNDAGARQALGRDADRYRDEVEAAHMKYLL